MLGLSSLMRPFHELLRKTSDSFWTFENEEKTKVFFFTLASSKRVKSVNVASLTMSKTCGR